jgi:hypothetical protein
MNALKFVHGGGTDGHLVSADHRGTFEISNSGDNNVFTDVLIVVAIDAARLNDGFGLSLNLEGRPIGSDRSTSPIVTVRWADLPTITPSPIRITRA